VTTRLTVRSDRIQLPIGKCRCSYFQKTIRIVQPERASRHPRGRQHARNSDRANKLDLPLFVYDHASWRMTLWLRIRQTSCSVAVSKRGSVNHLHIFKYCIADRFDIALVKFLLKDSSREVQEFHSADILCVGGHHRSSHFSCGPVGRFDRCRQCRQLRDRERHSKWQCHKRWNC